MHSGIPPDAPLLVAPLLEVTGLSKSWGGLAAVQDVSFALAAGEMLALIGPNGAGKSTCFDMLTGRTAPDRGCVLIQGVDATDMTPEQIWRLGVGRTFQIAATFPSMTVIENVQVGLLSHAGCLTAPASRTLASPLSDQFRAEALALLDQVGMREQAQRPCGELAYGDIKRVELALALSNRPRLLLMDEPTAGMAPHERTHIMRLVASLASGDGLGVLFTEHDMDAVFTHATRVLVLDRGVLIANGLPAQVAQDERVQQVYLGSGLLSRSRQAGGQ